MIAFSPSCDTFYHVPVYHGRSGLHLSRVLVAAVNKKTAPPQLHFFNNCFDDEFSNRECRIL